MGWRALDPAVRAERKRRRARRSLAYRTMSALGLAYLASRVGVEPGLELGEVFWATASGFAGLGAVEAARRVWEIERAPTPVRVAAPPTLPPAGSAARRPLERLDSRESALGELLTMLGPTAGDTWAEACEAARALRELAGRIVTLEGTRVKVPDEAVPGLDAALAVLRQRLAEGVSAYDRLVSAAADAVAAGADGPEAASVRRLEEAGDNLAGLARGLREVSRIQRG